MKKPLYLAAVHESGSLAPVENVLVYSDEELLAVVDLAKSIASSKKVPQSVSVIDQSGDEQFLARDGSLSDLVTYFHPRGAPVLLDNGKKRNIYLDDKSIDLAKKLGNGNASKGIRIALEKASLT